MKLKIMLKVIVVFTIGFLLLNGHFLIAESSKTTKSENGVVQVSVKGMVCDFCARGLEKVFLKKEEVNKIDVSLEKGLVSIHMKPKKTLEDKTIKKLITDNGISVEKIIRSKK